jgi:hypothetical protein
MCSSIGIPSVGSHGEVLGESTKRKSEEAIINWKFSQIKYGAEKNSIVQEQVSTHVNKTEP